MPLEIALSPQARVARFPPAPTQHWAYQAGTRGFIGVPFGGFLGPPWETADLTRILRRRLAVYSLPRNESIYNYAAYTIYKLFSCISGPFMQKNSLSNGQGIFKGIR